MSFVKKSENVFNFKKDGKTSQVYIVKTLFGFKVVNGKHSIDHFKNLKEAKQCCKLYSELVNVYR